LSAAALLGTKWIEPGLPAESIHTNRRTPLMLDVHTDALAACEIQRVDGVPVTSPAGAAFDIGRRLDLVAGVARVDHAQLAWPSRTSSDVTEPLISSTVTATSR